MAFLLFYSHPLDSHCNKHWSQSVHHMARAYHAITMASCQLVRCAEPNYFIPL